MATKIIKTSGGFTLFDMLGIGLAKSLTEQLVSRTPLGNGNYLSGGAKLAGAYFLPQLAGSGKISTILSAGLAVDGVEDILKQLLSGNLSLGGNAEMAVI